MKKKSLEIEATEAQIMAPTIATVTGGIAMMANIPLYSTSPPHKKSGRIISFDDGREGKKISHGCVNLSLDFYQGNKIVGISGTEYSIIHLDFLYVFAPSR